MSIDIPIETAHRTIDSFRLMATLQDRITTAMDAQGVGQAELARRLGIKQPSVHSLLNSSAGRTKYILDVARALGVRAEWLQYGENPMYPADDSGSNRAVQRNAGGEAADLADGAIYIAGRDWISVPRYDAAMSAGPGAIVDPNAEPLGYQLFEMQWIRAVTRASADRLAIVEVSGDSMEPTLRDGDWVLVDRSQRQANREGVYALAVGDAVWVKRISLNLREKLIQVLSDNSQYPMQELTEEDLSIVGRVVWIVGRKV